VDVVEPTGRDAVPILNDESHQAHGAANLRHLNRQTEE
jgi:hypothetical protein